MATLIQNQFNELTNSYMHIDSTPAKQVEKARAKEM